MMKPPKNYRHRKTYGRLADAVRQWEADEHAEKQSEASNIFSDDHWGMILKFAVGAVCMLVVGLIVYFKVPLPSWISDRYEPVYAPSPPHRPASSIGVPLPAEIAASRHQPTAEDLQAAAEAAELGRKGEAAIAAGDEQTALDCMAELRKKYPLAPEMLTLRAKVREMHGDVWGVIDIYDRSLQLDPEYAVWHRERARLCEQTGNWEIAVADYSALIRQQPRIGELYAKRANASFHTGAYKSTVGDLGSAFDLLDDPAMQSDDFRAALATATANPTRESVAACLAHLAPWLHPTKDTPK